MKISLFPKHWSTVLALTCLPDHEAASRNSSRMLIVQLRAYTTNLAALMRVHMKVRALKVFSKRLTEITYQLELDRLMVSLAAGYIGNTLGHFRQATWAPRDEQV